VAVVCTTSARHLATCLASLASQRGLPPFDVTVVCDPAVTGIEAVRQRFPDVRVVINIGQTSPLGLVSRALRECRGDLILLTKDHCTPGPNWVQAMANAQAPGRAAVGGRVECTADASATDWAFYFIDFYRYAAPRAEGASRTLTVCNASYLRSRLETIREVWNESFVEATVNDALSARYGNLWLHSASEVTMHRHLALRAAVVERYRLGRLFGFSRLAGCSAKRRLALALFSPALPVLLLTRMAGAASRSRPNARAFVRSFVPLTLMVLGRSFGEWLAYVTGLPPRSHRVSH
jgi:hypothetical protein